MLTKSYPTINVKQQMYCLTRQFMTSIYKRYELTPVNFLIAHSVYNKKIKYAFPEKIND